VSPATFCDVHNVAKAQLLTTAPLATLLIAFTPTRRGAASTPAPKQISLFFAAI
jgi:hypothetical protein